MSAFAIVLFKLPRKALDIAGLALAVIGLCLLIREALGMTMPPFDLMLIKT